MKNSNQERKWKFLKCIPFMLIIIIMLLILIILKKTEGTITIDRVICYIPDHMGLAMIVILSFFVLKSLSFIFPLSVLYLSSGVLFPPVIAVIVSAAGFWLASTVPYLIGRLYGKNLNEYIRTRYPKVEKIAALQTKNSFTVCFITRLIGILPADALSIYFGVCGIPYRIYSIASVAGSMLSIVTTTILGNKLKDPCSKEFLIILIIRIALIVFSFVMKKKLSLKEKRKKEKE